MIDPQTYSGIARRSVSQHPGSLRRDSSSTYVVNNVTTLWGMQVANLKTGRIITAQLPIIRRAVQA